MAEQSSRIEAFRVNVWGFDLLKYEAKLDRHIPELTLEKAEENVQKIENQFIKEQDYLASKDDVRKIIGIAMFKTCILKLFDNGKFHVHFWTGKSRITGNYSFNWEVS